MKKNILTFVIVALLVIFASVIAYFSHNKKDEMVVRDLQIKAIEKKLNLSEAQQDETDNEEVTIERKVQCKVDNKKQIHNEDLTGIEDLFDLSDIINPCVAGPTAFDVLAYMLKDKDVIENPYNLSITSLVNKRYDLKTPEGINLAIADIYELFRLCGTDNYQEHFSKEKYLTFVEATIKEILTKNPDNLPVLLLKSRVEYAFGNTQGAISTLKSTCNKIEQIEGIRPFSELVLTAKDIINCQNLSAHDKDEIQELIYQAGLPENSPLGKYLRNETSEVAVSYLRSSLDKDPFDLSESKAFHRGIVPDDIIDGIQILPELKDIPTEKGRLGFAAFRVRALMIENDARGLVELSNCFKKQGIDKELVSASQVSAMRRAGLTSPTVDVLQRILDFKKQRPKYPDLVASSKYQLALIYYEQGDYVQAERLIKQIDGPGVPYFLDEKGRDRFNCISADLKSTNH